MRGDLVQAWRALVRMPIMATVVVLSLGIGIGANTVVFSWIQALVLRPLPGVPDASRFHLVETESAASFRPGLSWTEFNDLRSQLRSFEDLMAFRMVPFTVGETAQIERAYGLLVSGNYFSVLGITPALGRFMRPDEAATRGREPVVVISYEYWHTRFSGAPNAIGRTIRINGNDLSVIGVAPQGFQGTVLGLQFDLWAPATMAPALLAGSRELEDRSMRGYYVMGALDRTATLAHADAEAAAAMQQLAREHPDTNRDVTAHVLPFWRASRGPQGLLLQGLGILQVLMLLLLFAVCGNTANLVLARASARVKEVAVRLAVGAGWWRIVRLLLVENMLLGLGGAMVGALLTVWGTTALRAMPLLTTQFPVRFQTSLNAESLAFAVLLGVVSALLFGAIPAVQLARVLPQSVLRSGNTIILRGGLRGALMAVEAGLAMVVLVAAALFFRSFQQTRETDPGFQPRGVLLAAYDLTGRGTDASANRQFADRVLRQLRALPDVEAAAIASSIPLDIHGLPVRTFSLEGRARVDGTLDQALSNTVTPGYFAAMSIPLLSGRDFAELTDTAQPPQAIVNQEFVRRYVGEGEALGRRVTMGDTTHTIVAVVRTSLNDSFSESPTPVIYLSYRDRPSRAGEMHLRTTLTDETVLAPAVRRAIRELDQSLPVYNVRTLTQHVEMNLALRRIPARMFAVLGPLMLVLAAIGIYAVVAYNVAHRTAEIGVRVALGASAARILRQVVGESLGVVAVGAALGWGFVAYIYVRFMRGGLDPAAFAGVPLLLLAVATAACWLPARRASQVDPVAALRAE
jgi:putative ABC transport system permease protein